MDTTTTKENEMTELTLTTEVYSTPIDDGRAIEVHVSDKGEHWVGMTFIHDPKDWEFHPKEQFGLGETGRNMAVAAAEQWAKGIRFDMAR